MPEPTPDCRTAAPPEVLVLVAHPQLEQSRANRALMRAAGEAAAASGGRIEVRDLYALYPDYLIDVAAEQALLARRAAGGLAAPDPLVPHAAADEAVARRGAGLRLGLRPRRHARCAARTCGWSPPPAAPEDSYRPDGYNRYFFDAFLPPYEQTAALCGMRFLPPLLLHGAHRVGDAAIAAHARVYAERLRELPRLARARRAAPSARPARCRPARARRPRPEAALMEHGSWLTGSLVYLAAAVLAVPLAKALGLGSIIGYLAAGIAIGPWGLKLVTDPQDMLHFAEFGVVLMLFLVGLELEPRRLWALRRPIFGWGSVQLFGSAALMTGAAVLFGVDWRIALVAALGLAMSSTAIGLGVLAERNLMATTSGQSVLSVMLLQDVAAIPILAFVPLLAVGRRARRAAAAGSAPPRPSA